MRTAKILERSRDIRDFVRYSAYQNFSGRALGFVGLAVAVFLAVLELLRLLLVRALQAEEFGEIYLETTGESLTLEGYEEEYR